MSRQAEGMHKNVSLSGSIGGGEIQRGVIKVHDEDDAGDLIIRLIVITH